MPRTVIEPSFVETELGRRFYIFRAPGPDTACRGAFVHVPAFGEEMNKARRMTALQARKFAEQGIATVQIDLYGTGDSDGDFRDARWDYWIQDVVTATNWLEHRTGCRVGLWGVRLGALLAAQVAHGGQVRSKMLVLWQPVTNGELFLTQFLRLRVASGMLSGDKARVDTIRLREGLYAGESVEIGGYELAPALAMELDVLRLADFPPTSARCSWIEIAATDSRDPLPASRKVIGDWRDQGVDVTVRTVGGEPFWSSVEIAECANLIDETVEACADLP